MKRVDSFVLGVSFIADTFDAIFHRLPKKKEGGGERTVIDYRSNLFSEIVSKFLVRQWEIFLLVELSHTGVAYNIIRREPKVAKGSIIYPAGAESVYVYVSERETITKRANKTNKTRVFNRI